VNGCQQGFRSVASFGFGGQVSALKPPQAICKPLYSYKRTTIWQLAKEQLACHPIDHRLLH
jgi:hypothetical protein